MKSSETTGYLTLEKGSGEEAKVEFDTEKKFRNRSGEGSSANLLVRGES